MDIGLREWIIVIGVIVIAAILFDAWRRMSGNRNTLKFRLDRNLADLPEEDNPEIMGPARVVSKQEPSLGDDDNDASVTLRADSTARKQPPIDTSVDALSLDDQQVPTLLNPFDDDIDEPLPESSDSDGTEYDEILIIHVVARNEQGFKGPALLQSILESGLRFGAMDIFHRHESMTGNGDKLFSMANALNPGTFDLDDMELFSTRAVCFFMGLPGPRNSRQAFDLMIAAARKLAKELDGDLKDDHRSVLTAQTIEHYRERIADFERQRLTQKL
ncbi:cell division protein ZipA [Pseudomonas sp. C27(2019)]|uniref:cell division protein ZipA n=1 Tax=Pseudomonas sp. C27(2019) TaxID=2604941 RepID=UPI001246ED75|nr:cell division protein ZipA [Pseudomonas sp. C27(2019)]QEY58370.1 cell division protein ZipA [Pseudomonas sp. C27(2019)]